MKKGWKIIIHVAAIIQEMGKEGQDNSWLRLAGGSEKYTPFTPIVSPSSITTSVLVHRNRRHSF